MFIASRAAVAVAPGRSLPLAQRAPVAALGAVAPAATLGIPPLNLALLSPSQSAQEARAVLPLPPARRSLATTALGAALPPSAPYSNSGAGAPVRAGASPQPPQVGAVRASAAQAAMLAVRPQEPPVAL